MFSQNRIILAALLVNSTLPAQAEVIQFRPLLKKDAIVQSVKSKILNRVARLTCGTGSHG